MFFLLSSPSLFFFCSFSPYIFFFVDSNTNKLLKTQQGFNTSCMSWEDAQNMLGFWSEAGVLESAWKPRCTCRLIGDESSSLYSWLVHNCCTVACRVSSLPIKSSACSAVIRGEGIDPTCDVLPCFMSKYLLGSESVWAVLLPHPRAGEAPCSDSPPSRQQLCTLLARWQA